MKDLIDEMVLIAREIQRIGQEGVINLKTMRGNFDYNKSPFNEIVSLGLKTVEFHGENNSIVGRIGLDYEEITNLENLKYCIEEWNKTLIEIKKFELNFKQEFILDKIQKKEEELEKLKLLMS